MTLLLPYVLIACAPGDPSDKPAETDSSVDTSADTDSGADTAPGDDTASDRTFPRPDRLDADGDGYVDRRAGGDDCDDSNAAVHPGAHEDCGGADMDCDGETWRNCGEVQASSDAYVRWIYPDAPWAVPVADVTGDGAPDLLLAGTSQVGYAVGGALGMDGAAASIAHVWAEYDGQYLYNMFDAGDVDGDGFNDLVVSDPLVLQSLAVVFGPAPVDGQISDLTDAATIWESPPDEPVYAWGEFVSGGADLDGDGLKDVMVERLLAEDVPSKYRLDLFLGGTSREPRVVTLQSAEWQPPVLLGTLTPDLDGDGVDDILINPVSVSEQYGVQWLSGAVATASDGGALEDLVGGSFDSEATSTYPIGMEWFGVGDWDEDGHADVVGLDSLYAETADEGAYFDKWSYYGRVQDGLNVADGVVVGDVVSEHFCGRAIPWLKDGARAGGVLCAEFKENWREGFARFRIFPPEPLHGKAGPSDLRHLDILAPTAAGITFDYPTSGPDVTGDGLGDVAMVGDDGVYLLPGFEIPWDDPAAW